MVYVDKSVDDLYLLKIIENMPYNCLLVDFRFFQIDYLMVCYLYHEK